MEITFVQMMAQGQLGGVAQFLPLIAIAFIFYFLLILPAQRRQKKTREMLNNLKNGDRVITSGGIYGTIVGLDDETVTLRVADQVKIRIAKSAVAGLQRPEASEKS